MRFRLTPFEAKALLRAVTRGVQISQVLADLGIRPSYLTAERYLNPAFDCRLLAAARAGAIGIRRLPRLHVAGPDAEAMQRILEALRAGRSLLDAAASAGRTNGWAVWMRVRNPDFDSAVVRATQAAVDAGLRIHPPLELYHRFCRARGCAERDLKARGLCARHYYQQYRTGRVAGPEQQYGRTVCSVPDCGRPHRARGYCSRCYERYVRVRQRSSQYLDQSTH